MTKIEAITHFKENGNIYPTKIRYFDKKRAQYVAKNISKIIFIKSINKYDKLFYVNTNDDLLKLLFKNNEYFLI